MANRYDCLKLENQLCFPLYAASKEVVRHYKPFLDKLDLTYTQYITMMVMWEHKSINVKTLGEYVYLDSGTLTPLLKKLESKGYIERNKAKNDERELVVSITKKGEALKEKAVNIPSDLLKCININMEDGKNLYTLLYKLLDEMKK